jgi:nitronate monooxygenase
MFLAIIASTALAISLARKTPGVNGFVIEGPTAGGHNAPPRGVVELVDGEPLYGPRDEVDLEKVAELGLPFWLAGGQATPERLKEAQEAGAAGIQVGTAFAFCEESGLDPVLRTRVLHEVRAGRISIFTDPLASPTGFPFKVIELEGTLSEDDVVEARERRCDLGYLRVPYTTPEGRLGYRCPAEPVDDYVRKGGDIADTVGRKCICNGLTATIGLGQRRHGSSEPPIMTAGNDLVDLGRLLDADRIAYTAEDVVTYLLGEPLPTLEAEHVDARHDEAGTAPVAPV